MKHPSSKRSIFRRRLFALAAVVTVTAITAARATAFHGNPHGGELELEALRAVLSPEQQARVKSFVMAEHKTLKRLHEQLRAARRALVAKLLSPDAQIDVSKEVAAIKAAEGALLDERVKIGLMVRGTMSPSQLARASALWHKLVELERQRRTLLLTAAENSSAGQKSAEARSQQSAPAVR